MRGIPYFSFGAFDAAAAFGRLHGFQVINPADLDRSVGFDPYALPSDYDWNQIPQWFDLRAAVRRDIDAIFRCDAIAMLPGWEKSKGATAEYHLARWLGLEVLDATTFEPF